MCLSTSRNMFKFGLMTPRTKTAQGFMASHDSALYGMACAMHNAGDGRGTVASMAQELDEASQDGM